MSYNFDMQRLLDTFDGDAEKLAQAFADSLNSELAKQRQKTDLQDAATDVCEAWKCFVDEYFANRSVPNGIDLEELYITEDTVIHLMELIMRIYPYIELFNEYMGKIEDLSKEVAEEVEKKLDNTSYEDVMRNFFKKNNL